MKYKILLIGIGVPIAIIIIFTIVLLKTIKHKKQKFIKIADTYTKPLLQSFFSDMEYEYFRSFSGQEFNSAEFFDYSRSSGQNYVKTTYSDVPVEFNITTLFLEDMTEINGRSAPSISKEFQGPWIIINKACLPSEKITVMPYRKKGVLGKLFGRKEIPTGDPDFDKIYQVYGDINTVKGFLDKDRRDKMIEINRNHSNVFYSFETDRVQIAYKKGNILSKTWKVRNVEAVFRKQLDDLLDLINRVIQL